METTPNARSSTLSSSPSPSTTTTRLQQNSSNTTMSMSSTAASAATNRTLTSPMSVSSQTRTSTSTTTTTTPTTTATATIGTKTPPRHNYANPHTTPIASIKRPRSSLTGGASNSNNAIKNNKPTRTNSTTTASETPSSNTTTPSTPNFDQLSPMHPIKPVVRRREPVVTDCHHQDMMLDVDFDADTPTNNSSKITANHSDDFDLNDDDHDDDDDFSRDSERERQRTQSWVGKVDALFSPVLNFLNQQENIRSGTHDNNDQHSHNGALETQQSDTQQENEQHQHHKDTDDNKRAASASTTTTADVTDNDMTPTNSSTSSVPDMPASSLDDDEQDANNKNQTTETDNDDARSEASDEMSLQPVEQPEDADEFNPWQFIKSLPAYHAVRHLVPPVRLPPKLPSQPPLTLVLDLDETLVHCTVDPVEQPDMTFPVDFHGITYKVHVRLRPHLFEFLESCRGKYEVVVFTASQKVYANELLNRIDPDNKYIQHRLYRESCLSVEGNFLKDLTVLGRDLQTTILVDNSPHAFGYQIDNGIPIESWFDNPHDRELLKLARFLEQVRHQMIRNNNNSNNSSSFDVRPTIRRKFKSAALVQAAPVFMMM